MEFYYVIYNHDHPLEDKLYHYSPFGNSKFVPAYNFQFLRMKEYTKQSAPFDLILMSRQHSFYIYKDVEIAGS